MSQTRLEYDTPAFVARMRKRTTETQTAVLTRMRVAIFRILRDILKNSPVWTGASSGIPGTHPISKGHPAAGMTIGNVLNGGESGWQYDERHKGSQIELVLMNPMWQHYLKYVEYGLAPNVRSAKTHFVARAMAAHRSRRHD